MGETGTIPSVEEVDATLPDDLVWREIVDGQVLVPVTGTTDPHQHVVVELSTDFVLWARGTGALVRSQTFDVRTTRTRLRQPDLLVVLAEHRDRVVHGGMRGAPDLVVEVLSPSTRAVDLGDKRWEYAELGVGEYWCIDHERRRALIFSPPGAEPVVLDETATLSSVLLPGFAVPLAAVLPG